jgi:hypothetical protein
MPKAISKNAFYDKMASKLFLTKRVYDYPVDLSKYRPFKVAKHW